MANKAKSPALPAQRFFDRELQWLEFNRRVLHEASDKRTPLLERVHFLGIFTSNLDEFIMKRVGGLKRQIDYGIAVRPHGELPVLDQLAQIRKVVQELLGEQAKIYRQLVKDLSREKILLKKWKDLSVAEKKEAKKFYKKQVFPVLTPLVVDPAHPFPFISNLSLSLGVSLETTDSDELLFARIKVPEVFPQWLQVQSDDGSKVFVSLVQVIQYNLKDLFPGMKVKDVMPFRITRNADLERDEEDAEDLLELIAEEIKQRRFAEAIRLEHGGEAPWMVDLLKSQLELQQEDIYEIDGLLDYTSLGPISRLNCPELKYSVWEPQLPEIMQEGTSVFDVIRRGDQLVHHPYDSFKFSVQRFVEAACNDSNVLAIKMTLYRMGDDNPMIESLIRAAEAGKQVVCVIELKARFDEKRNIYWAQQMEKAGIHVVYGMVGYKVHAKTILVLRKERDKIASYGHIGTGNYNHSTARFYTDVGLFTCDEKITEDMVQLFHMLTSRSFDREFQELLVAPISMRDQFINSIEEEIKQARLGKNAHIIAKFNSLGDRRIIDLLYKASGAGVKVDLIVRGFCRLKPQVKGLSENIRVLSVIGRFLEHSRIFYFRNNQKEATDGLFYIGSADWLYRNLNRRIEVSTPLKQHRLKQRCWDILNAALEDNRQCWEMQSDGTYVQRQAKSADLGSQERLMQMALLRSDKQALSEEFE